MTTPDSERNWFTRPVGRAERFASGVSTRTLRALLEIRAAPEFAILLATLPWLRTAPEGDGHPVLLMPGFAAGDASLEPLRLFLRSRGYEVESWGLGRNKGFNRRFAGVVEQKVRFLHHRHGRTISLIGWSLGGVFAFYAAHSAPECVRMAISLGSPLRLDADRPPPPGVRAMYQALSHPLGPVSHQARSRSRAMRTVPPVPSTCIYSMSDGVVPPHQATLEGDPASHENICVPGSHSGLGINSLVMWIVADRLAQPEGEWQPFKPEGLVARALQRSEAACVDG
ncbi:MAG TPA: alpha/beta hydrolase [Steroidobacteraceae bacterium]|nr:alpha/beta hydrolase [Steroidobacteraceae bacterium]